MKNIMETLSNSNGDRRRYVVDVLAALFGIASWIAINGVYVEFPLLVAKLPEGWNLPSYLTVVIQAANIGPLVYGVLHRFAPRKVNETSTGFFILTVGTLSCLLLVFMWDITAVVGGKKHSVALMIIVFFISIVDCTSSVVFPPFIAFFKDKYLISLFIGEGFSSLLPGTVSLIQGIGRTSKCENITIGNGSSYMTVMVTSPPLFGVEVFCGFLCVMMGVSFVAFVLLRFLDSIKSERNFEKITKESETTKDKECEAISDRRTSKNSLNYGTSCSSDTLFEAESSKKLTTSTFFYLLILQAWICFLANGVLPSISSYYCLPYGDLAYHLATSLGSCANPLICLASFYLATRKPSILTVTTVVGSLIALYLFIAAASSPSPPFVGTIAGQVLVVIASIGFTGTISYTKTSIATVFRAVNVRALFWYGVATQIGSAIGAVSMFIAVNFYHSFKSYNPCK